MSTDDEMLSRKEAAAFLGVGRDSIKRLVDNGKLYVIRMPVMGGRGEHGPDRFELGELRRFKERYRTGGRR